MELAKAGLLRLPGSSCARYCVFVAIAVGFLFAAWAFASTRVAVTLHLA